MNKPTKRYLIGSRRGPTLDPQAASDIDVLINTSAEATLIKRTPVGRRVVEMSEGQVRELKSKNPHLVIEEDEELELHPMPGLPDIVAADVFSRRFRVIDGVSGNPIPGVTLFGIGDGVGYRADTGADGEADLQTAEAGLPRLIASPRDTYWSRVIESVQVSGDTMTIALLPLPVPGYHWGHRLMQFNQVHPHYVGRGVRVAVIDSGVSDRVRDFSPRGGLNTIDGQDRASWNHDEEGHGTHCAGIVNSGRRHDGLFGGAPAAHVYSVKVFPGGHVSDLVEAVEWSIQNRIDVISMSLGSPNPSSVLEAALVDANARGITVVAAAGNDAGAVSYPAGFRSVIAVSAIGRFRTFPADSGHTLKIGELTDRTGQLFSANFTNYGEQVTVCAPGVAVLSTVPSGYVCWDGTSMACPMVSALAALVLEAHPWIRTGNARQPDYVQRIITSSAVNLGLPRAVQGAGLPRATASLFPARSIPMSYSQPYAATM